MTRGRLKVEARRRITRALDLLLVAAAFIIPAACRQPEGAPQISLVPASQARAAHIEVTVSDAERASLRRATMTEEEWQQLLAVSVKPSAGSAERVPIAGRYTFEGNTLRFTPLFPFDSGREYEVRYGSTAATVALPARAPAPPTFVTRVYPSADLVPENQLRLYIHFSAPMGRRGGVDRVKLLDDRGREVEMPFLPLEAEFWNADRTRYTVFFDPGRQKRGILPNREMGPSLVQGRSYTLVIDKQWADGNSNPLRESFSKRFRVGPPALTALAPKEWRLRAPAAGTREPVSLTFPRPLDHALLLNAIALTRDGEPVTGEVSVEKGEREWLFTPSEAWRPGRYQIRALPFLEDVAGNRIGRAFEVREFSTASAAQSDSSSVSLPFTIIPTPPTTRVP